MTTLKSIADKLDVSVSLVSRVLNDRMGTTGARQELIDAIRRTAREMDYQKNVSAVAMREGRHNAIGIYMHNYGRPGSGNFDSLFRGIAMGARKRKQRFMLDFIEDDDDYMPYTHLMKKTVIDGVLLGGVPHAGVNEMMNVLTESDMPTVTIFDQQIHPAIPNIGVNQFEVGRMATAHLIERGCRKIAHVVDFADRLRGYGAALAESGVAQEPRLVYREPETSFSYDRGLRAAHHFLEHARDLDGVFAQSDEEAVAIMNCFMDAGIRVPDDVRIIGVDNAPYCAFARVPLSSISQRGIELGQKAVIMLMEAIEGGNVSSVSGEPKLIARESTR